MPEKQKLKKTKVYLCNGCCCGHPRFSESRALFKDLLGTFTETLQSNGAGGSCSIALTGCMGPCSLGNNVVVATPEGKKILFGGINQCPEMKELGQFVSGLATGVSSEIPETLKPRVVREVAAA